MELVANVSSYGDEIEIPITGIASVERISPGQIRVSYYRRGKSENRIVACLVWDLQHWQEAVAFVAKHRLAIERDIAEGADSESLH